MKRRTISFFVSLMALSFFTALILVFSCEKESAQPATFNDRTLNYGSNEVPAENYCGQLYHTVLMTESGIEKGTADIYNDRYNLYILLKANQGYLIGNMNLNISERFDRIPMSQTGDPLPDEFNFIYSSGIPRSNKLIRIKRHSITSNIIISCLTYIITEDRSVDLRAKPERTWIKGKRYGTLHPGMLMYYSLSECPPEQFLSSEN